MASFQMPDQVKSLPKEQQDAINKVLVDTGLLTSSGSLQNFSSDKIPPKNKEALDATISAIGAGGTTSTLGLGFGCAAARIAEAAAIVACASVPGGQIAIVACVTAAHLAADEACK